MARSQQGFGAETSSWCSPSTARRLLGRQQTSSSGQNFHSVLHDSDSDGVLELSKMLHVLGRASARPLQQLCRGKADRWQEHSGWEQWQNGGQHLTLVAARWLSSPSRQSFGTAARILGRSPPTGGMTARARGLWYSTTPARGEVPKQ